MRPPDQKPVGLLSLDRAEGARNQAFKTADALTGASASGVVLRPGLRQCLDRAASGRDGAVGNRDLSWVFFVGAPAWATRRVRGMARGPDLALALPGRQASVRRASDFERSYI
jgi:hypothetical protein